MRANGAMRRFLDSLGVNVEETIRRSSTEDAPELVKVDGCVFLSDEYRRSKHVSLQQFPDRTGYECFVNRVHLPGNGKGAILRLFEHVATLRKALRMLNDGEFEIIVSVANEKATLRFHKCRVGEKWLSDNIEQYREEAILAVEVDDRD